MNIRRIIKTFVSSESGVIQAELAALGGVALFVGVLVVASVSDGVEKLDEDRGYQVREQDKITSF